MPCHAGMGLKLQKRDEKIEKIQMSKGRLRKTYLKYMRLYLHY